MAASCAGAPPRPATSVLNAFRAEEDAVWAGIKLALNGSRTGLNARSFVALVDGQTGNNARVCNQNSFSRRSWFHARTSNNFWPGQTASYLNVHLSQCCSKNYAAQQRVSRA
eukprot:4851700-Pleurochrysis_carterae.AAC.1